MLDRFKQIPARLLEIWNKYTKKQRTMIISITAAIVLALLLLIVIIGRVNYKYLKSFSDISMTSRVVNALKNEKIAYKVGNDGVSISVDEDKYYEAILLMSTDEFAQSIGLDRNELLKNDMSTTNKDKQVKANIYMQDDIANELKKIEGIDDASVSYNINEDGTDSFLNPNKEIVCSVNLKTNDRFKASAAETIAYFVAGALGNQTTESITIMDQHANLLYNGGQEDDAYYSSKVAEYEAGIKKFTLDSIVRMGLANGFDYVDPGLNLVFDYSKESSVHTEYIAGEGHDQGLISSVERTSSESSGTSGDPVGTDSNDEEPNYYIQNTGTGPSSYSNEKIIYTPSVKITTTVNDVGNILFDESSLQVTLNKNRYITRSDFGMMPESQTMTIEEYLFNNKDPRPLALAEEYYTAYSACTGIPAESISLLAYETIIFIEDEETPTNWELILKIILAVLIIGLLIFVVFRGMAPVEITELEPELSVEKLLATTKENQALEDIEFSEMTETRKLIEKFVEEKPDAVANLLRSWLEDDWD